MTAWAIFWMSMDIRRQLTGQPNCLVPNVLVLNVLVPNCLDTGEPERAEMGAKRPISASILNLHNYFTFCLMGPLFHYYM